MNRLARLDFTSMDALWSNRWHIHYGPSGGVMDRGTDGQTEQTTNLRDLLFNMQLKIKDWETPPVI